MSIISVVYLPEGIVLAADSRLTGRKEYKDDDDNNVIEKFPLSDNAQKVVLLNKCKVGIDYPAEPVRYVNNGVAFEKCYEFKEGETYPDGDVSYETFFCRHMTEIESLSPLYTVRPGEYAEHTETWNLYRIK